MSHWADRFEKHPVHESLSRLIEHLNDTAKETEFDTEDFEQFERLQGAVNMLQGLLGGVDPPYVPKTALDNIKTYLDNLTGQLNSFQSNSNVQHLKNANEQVDSILGQIHLLHVPRDPAAVEGLREAVVSYRRSVAQHLHNLETQLEKTEERVGTLQDQLKEATKEVSVQKGRLDTAISDYQTKFSDAQEERQRQFTQSEEERRKEATEKLSSLIDEQKARLDAVVTESSGLADGLIAYLKEQKEKAEGLLSAIGIIGMAGGFKQEADRERKTANFWHGVTGFFLLGLLVFAVYTFISLTQDELHLAKLGARAIAAIAFGIGVAWAARQADKHQSEERRFRRMELELAAIHPFLANLPPETQYAVKQALADRMFGQKDASSEIIKAQEKTSGSILDVAALLAKTLENFSKKS